MHPQDRVLSQLHLRAGRIQQVGNKREKAGLRHLEPMALAEHPPPCYWVTAWSRPSASPQGGPHFLLPFHAAGAGSWGTSTTVMTFRNSNRLREGAQRSHEGRRHRTAAPASGTHRDLLSDAHPTGGWGSSSPASRHFVTKKSGHCHLGQGQQPKQTPQSQK